MSKFYTYNQNNPFGTWAENMPRCLIVEALDAEDADRRVQEHGVYFDGIAAGKDCNCCGDRWDTASDWNASDGPLVDEAERTEDPTASTKVVHWDGAIVYYR